MSRRLLDEQETHNEPMKVLGNSEEVVTNNLLESLVCSLKFETCGPQVVNRMARASLGKCRNPKFGFQSLDFKL